MNKSSDSPRRLYARAGQAFVNFDGRFYGAPSDSVIDTTFPVTCVKLASDGGRARVQVTQRKPHAKSVTEVWRTTMIPRGHGTKHAA